MRSRRDRSVTAADLYASVIEGFLDDEIQYWSKALLTGASVLTIDQARNGETAGVARESDRR